MRIPRFAEKLALAGILFLGLLWVSSFAQILTGNIEGTVKDEEGAVLPGVNVEISSPSLMGVRSVVTTERGFFRFVNLSPGIYKITFNLEGFLKVENQNVRVSVNSTITIDTVLRQKTLEKAVTVLAQAPVVDVTKSSMSTTFSKENIEKIPSGRETYMDIVKQAAGLTPAYESSSRIMSFGSNAQSNGFYVDGVNMSSPELGIAWTSIQQDAMTEVETMGVGAPAEYGKLTGAVVNIVTKSGGNNLEGSLFYYGQYNALTGDNNPDSNRWFSYKRDTYYDVGFSVGGPILKDKIWFFSSTSLKKDVSTSWQNDPAYPPDGKDRQGYLKLTFQISPKYKITAAFHYDNQAYTGSPSPIETKEAVWGEGVKGPLVNFLFTWITGKNSFLDIKYSGWWSRDDALTPFGGDFNKKLHYDLVTGAFSNAPDYSTFWDIRKQEAQVKFSYFAEDFLKADHDFKAGVQYINGYNHGWGGYSGGSLYLDYGGQPYLLYQRQQWQYGGLTNSIGAFVDDSVKIGSRLTVNLGLRYDYQRADYPSFSRMSGWTWLSEKAPGIDNLINWKVFSPRIGFAYSLTADRKTLLKAHYGRYYDSLLIAQFDMPGPGVTDFYASFWDGAKWVLYNFAPGTLGYIMDPKLKNPYADQFFIGLERELFRDFSVGALYVYKNEKDLLGQEDRGATYELVQRVSPDNGKTYTVYNQTSPIGSNVYWQTNPKGYDLTYRGLVFTLNKRYSDNWMLNASLIWSKNEGLICTAKSTTQMAMGWYAGSFGKDPNDLINARGYLQNDRRWVFKLQVSYSFPWGIMASANYLYQSGNPYAAFVRVLDLNQAPYRSIFEAPRGDRRFKPYNKLDLRIEKTLPLHGKIRLRALADIFNVFNDGTVVDMQSYNVWSEGFGVGSYMLTPRRVQLGVSLDF